MKKIFILLLIISSLLFIGCGSTESEIQTNGNDCGLFKDGQTFEDGNNFCQCNLGEITCVKIETPEVEIEEEIIEIKREINKDLTNLEQENLDYIQNKNQYSRIIFLNSEEYGCDDCYKINYKKDREIIQIEIVDNEKTSEKLISGQFEHLLIDEFTCNLFEGEFTNHKCLITKDETEYRQREQKCGHSYYGDCTAGYACVLSSQDSIYGNCHKR